MDPDTPPTQEPVTNRILTAVADEEDADPRELEPLYATINPEALESLFRDGSGMVLFEYHGYMVTVDHQHDVEVEPLGTRPEE